jgi:cytochrome c oxidase subunit I+III
MIASGRMLQRRAAMSRLAVGLLLIAAGAGLVLALGIDLIGHWRGGLRPATSGYGAMVYMAAFLQSQVVAVVAGMVLFVLARLMTGKLDRVRRVTFDNTSLLCHYAVGQGLLGLLLTHGFPRAVA